MTRIVGVITVARTVLIDGVVCRCAEFIFRISKPNASSERLKKAREKMTEYIKREDVLALSHYDDYDCEIVDVEDVEKLPSADVVERKHGEWDKDSDMAFYWKCSECGAYLFWRHEEFMVNGNPHYCPNCGAQMERSEE